MPVCTKRLYLRSCLMVPLLLAGLMAHIAWAQPQTVFVSILPQKFIVEQIGADAVDVAVMVAPGASPHTYEPKPGQMETLSKAELYFSVGVSFEKAWLPRFAAANRRMKIVPMDQGIEKLPMAAHAHADDDHDPAHHSHGHAQDQKPHPHAQQEKHESLLDPHIWLSPPLVKIMARHALDALLDLAPENADLFRHNHDAFISRLDELHARIGQILADSQGQPFMVFHPSWGYFAHTYGLVQIPIEIDGKEPKPAQIQHLIQEARELGIKVVFVQPQFSARSARMIADALDGRVLPADPLAYEWDVNLLEQARVLQKAVR
jgi:zinc transport system substrate-binding protein